MNREQREQTWIDLGLAGALEMMDASCSLAERLTETHIGNPAAYRDLMVSIAAEIVNNRSSL